MYECVFLLLRISIINYIIKTKQKSCYIFFVFKNNIIRRFTFILEVKNKSKNIFI